MLYQHQALQRCSVADLVAVTVSDTQHLLYGAVYC